MGPARETFSSGIADPQPTPPRAPGSVRRTSHVDMSYPGDGGVVFRSACRDLVTSTAARMPALATLTVAVNPDYVVEEIFAEPDDGSDLVALIGTGIRAGFRARVDGIVDDHGSPLYVLLDELPVAGVIAGYAVMYRGAIGWQTGTADAMTDICSGWRSEGLMIRSIRATGHMLIPLGPPAPGPEVDDPEGWHPLPDLPPGSMRRRRLIDVGPPAADGSRPVFATFRDVHVDTGGDARVLHEYTLDATLDAGGVIASCVATPRVLPWHECPDAASSAGRLVGLHPSEVRRFMRSQRGIGTCTHLNDLLRSLADLDTLALLAP